jgi:TRAP-type C4-dicarboxylate transport system permease small subunit
VSAAGHARREATFASPPYVTRPVAAFATGVKWIANIGLVLSCACLLVMLVYTAIAVIGRYSEWWQVLGADEVGAYAMAGTFFFGLAYSFRVGAFIAVAPFKKRIPPRVLPFVEVVQLLIALVYTLLILKYAWESWKQNYDFDTTSVGVLAWPNWVPMAVMPTGLAVLALQLVSLILERIFLGRPAPSGDEHDVIDAGVEE